MKREERDPFAGPVHGDIVIACAHRPRPERCHYHFIEDTRMVVKIPANGKRPAVSGNPVFILACDACDALLQRGTPADPAFLPNAAVWGVDIIPPEGLTIDTSEARSKIN